MRPTRALLLAFVLVFSFGHAPSLGRAQPARGRYSPLWGHWEERYRLDTRAPAPGRELASLELRADGTYAARRASDTTSEHGRWDEYRGVLTLRPHRGEPRAYSVRVGRTFIELRLRDPSGRARRPWERLCNEDARRVPIGDPPSFRPTC